MKNSLKTLAVWLIIGVILVVAISTILENSNTKLSYSDLIAKIDAENDRFRACRPEGNEKK